MKEIQVLSSDSEELANENCFQSIDLYIQTESSEGTVGLETYLQAMIWENCTMFIRVANV